MLSAYKRPKRIQPMDRSSWKFSVHNCSRNTSYMEVYIIFYNFIFYLLLTSNLRKILDIYIYIHIYIFKYFQKFIGIIVIY
jgi:hypothetical protein